MCTISRHWNIGPNAEGFSSDPYREIINAISTQPDAAKRRDVACLSVSLYAVRWRSP
jgi:hypothetical protein